MLSRTPLSMESLEPRILLAVDVALTGSDVSFSGDDSSSDHVYVRTFNNQLQWSSDGTTFSVDLDSSLSGDQTLAIQGSTSQSLSVSGSDITLHLRDVAIEGASLNASAPIIQIDVGATVSTVLGDSNAGSITLQNATSITAAPGSTLNAGDAAITISAVDTPFQSFGTLTASAAVSLDNATITGGDVQITTEASAAGLFGVDSLLGAFTLNTKNFFEGLSLGGGYVKSVATADINISGGSITADNLTLDADATANAELTIITAIVGAAFGEMYPTATIAIDEGALIQTSSDVDISTAASLEAEVRATQFAFGLTSTNKEKYNVAIAAASGELASTISVGDANLQSGGDVSFTSQGVKKIDVGATAAAGREGVAGLAIGVSEIDSTVSTLVDGSVTASGDVTVLADLTSTQNDTDAGASVGEGSKLSKVKKGALTIPLIAAGAPLNEIQQLQNKLGSSKADTTAGKTGVAAAITLVSQTNDVTARIGENATVVSQNNDIEVLASSSDEIQNSSHSSVTSSGSAKNTRAKAWSASLLIGSLTNNAEAYIGRNAEVQAAGDLLVQSETRVPWEQQWARWNGLDSITDKINTNLGVQAGFFTTWTEASSKSEKLSVGGSVGVFSIDGHSDAFIDEGASVQTGAQTSIIAINENDTVNFGGQFATALPLPKGYGLAGAASRGSGVGGSVAAMTYENHVDARIKDNAVVNTGGLLVMSRTDERNISIVTQGGAADGTFAINGAGNLLFVDNFTLAQIDDGAQVTVGSLNVAVPRDFDTVDLANNGLFSDVPSFDPLEQIDGSYRVDVDTNEITLPYDHGFQSGDIVWYSNGGGVDIGGLSNNSAYTVSKIDDNTLQLFDGQQVVQLNLDETDGFGHSLLAGFEADSDVSGDTISGLPSYWEDNLPVRYFKAVSADTLTGLNPEQVYYLSVVDGGVQLLDAPDGSLVPIDPTGISGAQFLVPVTVDRDGASKEIVGLELKTRNPLQALDSNDDDVVSTDDEHIVSVTDDVYLTDASLLVLSDDQAGLYSGTGGFTKGRSVGAGVAIAVSDIHRQTNAIIGNLERDLGSTLGVGVDSANEIYLGYNHGFSEGELVTYAAGGDFPIAGLRDGESYFVNIVSDTNQSGDPTIKLARSILEAKENVQTQFALADVSPELGADSIDLGYTHGFQLGDRVTYSAGSGTAIGGLDEDTVYYVIPLSDTELALAESEIFATDAFSTIFDPRDTVNGDSLTFDHEHGFVDGERLLYSAGGGTAIDGLEDGEVVVAVYVDEYTIQLEKVDGTSIDLDASSAVGKLHAFQPGFIGTSDNVADNVIDVGYTHQLEIGDQVLYTASSPANAVGGLTSGEVYYVVNTGETTLLLATSEELAEKAKWRFFDSTTAISDVTDGNGNVSSVIDLALPHPYELNDALIYSTEAYYEDPDSQTISPLQYIDPTDGSTKTLVDGQTVYAIPADSDTALDPDTGTDITIYYGLQIALSEGGPALQLVTTNAAGIHGFHFEAAGIELTPTADSSTTHFLQLYERVDLDTSTGAGTDHTIRLALDPSSTTRATHGIGGTFDPAVAIDSQSDDGDAVTKIDLGFDHGFATGDAVIYSNGRGTSIGGLAHGVIYYVVKVDSTTIQLAESAEDAGRSENLVALDASVATGTLHGFGKVINATPAVDSHLNTIQFGQAHGFNTGDEVVYETNGGTAIGGLEDGKTYVVQVYEGDDTKIQLLNVQTHAVIGLDGTLATGDQHTLSEPISNTGFITSTGAGLVTSNNNGEIVSISLAGSETSKRKAGNFSDSESSGSEENPKYGISIAASFAINVVNDTTQAYIRDANLTAAALDLRAINVTEIDTGTGAIALATSTDEAKGLAGAFSVNVIDNSTTAWVDNASVTITGGDLEVDAENSSHIVAAALGLAGTSGAFALAGSVVVNVISAHANALIQHNSIVTVSSDAAGDGTGNLIVTASNDNQIIGVAGSIGVALGSGPTDRTGVGVAICINAIDSGASTPQNPRGTVALIEDSEVTAGGVIDVSATTTNTINCVAAAIAVAFASGKSMANAFSFSVNGNRTATTASVRRKHTNGNGQSGGKGVKVTASDDSDITSIAGNAAFGADSANGFALSLNVVENTVSSSIADTSLTAAGGDVQVLAISTPTIASVAAGGSVSGKAARQGSFSISALLNTTEAFITGSTSVTAGGTVLVSADDNAHVFTLGGSVVLSGLTGQASGEPLSSFGIANSTLVSVNTVKAYIDDDVTVQANANQSTISGQSSQGVIVSVDSTDTVTTIAAGGVVDASGSGIAIAGSATVTVLSETVHAYIGQGAKINQSAVNEDVDQSVVVQANDTTTLVGIAGAASIGLDGGGIGAGVDVAVVTKDVQAWLGEGSTVSAKNNVLIDAKSKETAVSVSGTIGVGLSTSSIAGSVGVSVYDITTKARIKSTANNVTTVSATNSVLVFAEESTDIALVDADLSGGNKVGMGGSFGVPILIKTTEAKIQDAAVVDAMAQLDGIAVNTGNFSTFGGDTSPSDLKDSVDLDNSGIPLSDKGYLQNRNASPEQMTGFKGVAVTAVNTDQVELYTLGAAFGTAGAAAQVSVGVNAVDVDTRAVIGDGAKINQTANAAAGASSNQSVHVAAGSDFFTRSIIGGVSGSGDSAAATPGVGVAYVTIDTHAYVAEGASIHAEKDVSVHAHTAEDLEVVGIAITGTGGTIAAAGAFAVVDLNNTTYAYLADKVTVDAGGNVLVTAEDLTDSDVLAGAAGVSLSGGGVGVSLGLSLIDKDTQAYIGEEAKVDALGNQGTFSILSGNIDDNGNPEVITGRGVGVNAFTVEDLFALDVAGAAGESIGVAGALSWQQIDSDTTAYIDRNAKINTANNNATAANSKQDVIITAYNTITASALIGSFDGGLAAGFGAGVDVGTIANETQAAILADVDGDSTAATDTGVVNARNDVRAAATSDRVIGSIAVSAGAGSFALEAGFTFWTIGDKVSASYEVDDQTEDPGANLDTQTEQVGNDTTDVDAGYEASDSNDRGDNSGLVADNVGAATDRLGSFTDLLSFGDSLVSETKAYIGDNATVTTGGDIEVVALENTEVAIFGGGGAGGVVGLGAGIAIVNAASKASATIGSGATVTAQGNLTVKASADEDVTAAATAVALGFVGVSAQYAEADVRSVQSASIAEGAQIKSANAVSVTADHTRDVQAITAAVDGSVGASAGFSGALVDVGGTVEAVVADEVVIGQVADDGTVSNRVSSVDISATSTTTRAEADTYALGGGVGLAIEGAEAQAKVNPVVHAATLDSVEIYTTGDIDVTATAQAKVEAEGLGVEVSAGAAGGFMGVLGIFSPTIVAAIGERNSIDSQGDVTVRSQQALLGTDKSAYASGFGVAAGLFIGVAGVSVKSESTTHASATVGADSTISATGGTVTIQSDIDNDLDAKTDGGDVGGIAAIGVNVSRINADTRSTAWLGDGVSVSADTLKVLADSTDSANGLASNNKVSFGVSFTSSNEYQYGTDVEISLVSDVTASIADNTNENQAIDVNELIIDADRTTLLDGSANDVSVSLIAGIGGARYLAVVDSDVNAWISDGVVANAETVSIQANNTTDVSEAINVTSATGGIGASAKVLTEFDVGHSTNAGIGEDAKINADYTLTGHPTAVSGGVNVTAINEGSFYAATYLGSAGLLGSSNNAQTLVNLDSYDAAVLVGDNAVLKSTGEITLATNSNVFSNLYTNAQSSALFNDTSTAASTTVTSANSVTIGEDALLETEDDINLLAGQTSVLEHVGDLAPDINTFELQSSTDAYSTFKNVSGDNSKVSAAATVAQTNTVTVEDGAKLRAVSDAYLLTDSGLTDTEASASFYTTVQGHANPSKTESATDDNRIEVNGDIEVGLFNRRLLELDENGEPTGDSDSSITVTADANYNLDDALSARINSILEETAWFSGTSLQDVYEEQRDFWTELVTSLGGTLDFDSTPVKVSGVVLPTALVSDIFATSGNIVFEAQNVTGYGNLTAPTDTTIQIVNNSALTLLMNSLIIPDRPGGQVRFNQIQVKSADGIKNGNSSTGFDDDVNLTFSFSYDPDNTTADADTEPLINVVNHAQPGEKFPSNLVVEGDVSNRSGDVSIDSGDGSVLVNAGLTAGSLSIVSGGDFILSDTDSDGDGFFHSGGDPFDLYSQFAETNEMFDAQVIDATAPISGTSGSALPDAGATIVAGSVLISAENLNLNGIIQSGIPYHTITVADSDSTLSSTTAALTKSYDDAVNAGTENPQRYTTLDAKYLASATGPSQDSLFESVQDTLALQWDAKDQRLVLLGNIEVKGGFMQLVGNRVLNTYGGELRVLDGYGRIDIRNETALDIVLSAFNTGRGVDDAVGVEGVILISEKSRAHEAVDGAGALNTKFTRSADGITITSNKKNPDGTQVDPELVTDTDTVHYTPQEGMRYQWVSSGSEGSETIYDTGEQPEPAGSIADVTTSDNIVKQVPDGRSELSSNGTYAKVDVANENDIYRYSFSSIDNVTDDYWVETVTTTHYLFSNVTTVKYDDRVTEKITTLTTHTHSVKGDYPIDITFLGDQGSVNIDSLGTVVIAGNIEARGGTININVGEIVVGEDDDAQTLTNDSATIESNDTDGVVTANIINLSAPGGIGTQGSLYLEQTHADSSSAVNSTSTGDEINFASLAGDLTLASVVASGTDSVVSVEATIGSIFGNSKANTAAHIQAGSVMLIAAGDAGAADQFVNIDTSDGAGHMLNATLGSDLYVRETSGDMYVGKIQGDAITIDVHNGSLLDATEFESAPRDPQTISELVTLWTDLGLIGTGADARKVQMQSDTIALHNFEYEQYWKLRNTLADPTDPASFDFQYSEDKVNRMLGLGYTVEEIDALEQAITDRFLELNAVFGPGGTYQTNNDPTYDPTTYDESFSYQLTQTEIDALTADFTFTEGGLLWNLSTGVTDRTDTTVFDEPANIIANTVNITVSDTVGNTASEVKSIEVDDGDIAGIDDDADNTTKIELLSAEPEDIAFFLEDANGVKTPWADVDDGDGIVEANEYNLIELTLREDLNVASRNGEFPVVVSATATDGVLLTGSDSVRIGQIDADTSEVRVKAKDGIIDGVDVIASLNPERVAAWTLDDSKNASEVFDSTGHDHTGVVGSGTTLGVDGATLKTGTAASFSGTGSGITAPYSAELNPDSFTFATWAKVTGGEGTYRSVVTSRVNDSGSLKGYTIYAANNNTWQFWTGDGIDGDSWNVLHGPDVELDEWVHLAISFDAQTNTKSFYVNGDLYATTTTQGYAPNTIQGTHIGIGGDAGTVFQFHGQIDDAQLFNVALSAAEVRSEMAKIGATNVIGGNLVIEADSLSIGSRSKPIAIDLTGQLTVRSAKDAYLASTTSISQPVNLDTAIVEDTFSLSSLGAILDANDPTDATGNQLEAVTNVIANEALFFAVAVGAAINPLEIEAGTLGGNIAGRMDVTAQGSVLVTNLVSMDGSLNVTAENDLLVGLLENEGGSVYLESLTGSILNNTPHALNLLVSSVDFKVNAASATIGTAENTIEVLQDTVYKVSGPGADPSTYAFISISGRPLGVFTRGNDIVGGEEYVQLADFDGDGYLDVLTSTSYGFGTAGTLLINNQDATFKSLGTIAPSLTSDTLVADVDNDGFPDIVAFDVTNPYDENNPSVGHFTILRNTADGTASFTTRQTFSVLGDFSGFYRRLVQVGDLTGDDALDILFFNDAEQEVDTYENDGTGAFTLRAAQPYPSWMGTRPYFELAELTGDGALDLVIGPTDNDISKIIVVTNRGDGIFDFTRSVFVTERENDDDSIRLDLERNNYFAIGDVDGNGLNDLLIAKGITSGSGITERGNELWLNQGLETIKDGDVPLFDSDGVPITEPVLGTTRLKFLKPLVEVADGVYAEGWDVGTFTEAPALVDLDFDGDLDLLLDHGQLGPGQQPNEVLILDDGQYYSTGQLLYSDDHFGEVAFGDLDNDADIDVIFGERVWLQSRVPLLETNQSFHFYENREVGEVLYTPTVVPPGSDVTYGLDLVTNDGTDVTNWFEIDDETGEIKVVDPTHLDYESLANHKFRFTVTITYFNGETNTNDVVGTMRDLDDEATGLVYPIVSSNLNKYSIDEDAPVGTTFDVHNLASDPEPFDRITGFEIVGGTEGYRNFVIDDDGMLTLVGDGLSWEDLPDGQKYVDLNIKAFDTEGNTGTTGTLRITVNNVYEGPSLSIPTSQAFGASYEFDARLDSDDDYQWENINSDTAIDWTLGSNVERVILSDQDPASIVAAYDFPGGSSSAGDFAVATSFQDISGNPTTGDMSLAIWFKPDDLENNQVLWETGGATIGSSLVLMQDEDLDQFVIRYTVKDGSSALITQSVLPDDAGDGFIEVVAAIELQTGNDVMQLYLNGELVDSDSDADIGDWAGSNGSGLGGRNSQTGGTGTIEGGDLTFGSFDGQIALVRFYPGLYLPNSTVLDGDGMQALALPINYAAIRDGVAAIGQEGSTIVLTRPFDSAGTEAVTMTASVGSVVDNGDGTWSWTYDATDGPDNNQVVTITATESSGLSESTTFQLFVDNLPPTLVRGANGEAYTLPVLISPAGIQFNIGRVGDPGTDTVTVSASQGQVFVHDSSPTDIWFWDPDGTGDAALDGDVIMITATDEDGAQTSLEFVIDYDAEPPQVSLNSDTVSVDEGSTAVNSGTYDGDDLNSATVSLGSITDNGDGTWSWSYDGAADGDADTQQVTITARDVANNVSTTTFDLVINNVAPTAELILDQTTITEGSPTTLQISDLTDPGVDSATQYIIDWGDGNTDTVTVPTERITGESESNDDGIAGASADDLALADDLRGSFDPYINYSLVQANQGDGPVWRPKGGWDGGYLSLMESGVANQLNAYASDRVLPVWTDTVTHAFEFRTDKDGADGWGWSLLNSEVFGDSGTGGTLGEEPNQTSSLGVGFDTFPNTGEGDNSVSLHYGALLASVDVTSASGSTIPFETGEAFRAEITLSTETAGSNQTVTYVTVLITNLDTGETMTPFDRYAIDGLEPYQGRVQIGARTGEANQTHDIDDVTVQYDSAPMTVIDDFEPINSSLSSVDTLMNSYKASVSGQINHVGDEDYYRLDVAASDFVKVVVNGDGSNGTIVALLDGDLNIIQPPSGSFSLDSPGVNGATYLVVTSPDGQPQSYTLTVEHARTSSPAIDEQLVSHVYADGPANYSVTVSIVDEDGTHKLNETLNVALLNGRPIIQTFDVPATTPGDETLVLTATASDPGGVDDPLSYSWTVTAPDGTQTLLSGPIVSYTPSSDDPGSHAITLAVTDDEGGVGTRTGSIEVEGAPTANAGGPYEVDEGKVLAIDAAFASDPNQDADSLTYLWDLDGDGVFGETGVDALFGDEVGLSPIFSASLVDGDATLNVTLRVIDDTGRSDDSVAVMNVNNVAPDVRPQTFFVDEDAIDGDFVGQVVSGDFVTDAISFAITGGSGQSVFSIDAVTGELTVLDSTQLDNSTMPTFTLEVEVTDDDGSSASATMTVLVEDVQSLEALEFEVDDGTPQQSNVDILTVRFNEATNIQGLINSGKIYDAVTLLDPSGAAVALDDGLGRFAYDDSSHTLTIDLTTDASGLGGLTLLSLEGGYPLELDCALIQEADGSHQLLDTDGVDDGVVRFAFDRIIGDFDGDGTVTIADRSLFLERFGTEVGDATYSPNFDFDGDGDIDRVDYAVLRSRLPRR